MGNYQWKNHQSSIYFLIYLFNLLFFIFRIGFSAVHGGKYYLVSEMKFSRYKQKVNKLVGEIIIDNFFRNLYSSNCSGLVGKIRKKVDDLFFFYLFTISKNLFPSVLKHPPPHKYFFAPVLFIWPKDGRTWKKRHRYWITENLWKTKRLIISYIRSRRHEWWRMEIGWTLLGQVLVAKTRGKRSLGRPVWGGRTPSWKIWENCRKKLKKI